MKINNIFESFAKSKVGQNIYGWASKPKSEKFLNNTLPQVETVLSTACYVWSTHKQDIEPDQKKLLQIQNVASGAVGIGVGSLLNRGVSKLGENIIKDLDTTKIDPDSIRKISTGLRVGLPIVTTLTLMRFVIPSITAWMSGRMMDKEREKKLDIKA